MRNPLADVKPITVGIFLLTTMWALFQWRDPTPPPVLDQALVAAMGVWFASEAVNKGRGATKKKSSTESTEDEDAEEDGDG